MFIEIPTSAAPFVPFLCKSHEVLPLLASSICLLYGLLQNNIHIGFFTVTTSPMLSRAPFVHRQSTMKSTCNVSLEDTGVVEILKWRQLYRGDVVVAAENTC
jgi:hypothetical protein